MIAVTGHFERPKVKKIAKKFASYLDRIGIGTELFPVSSTKLNRKKFSLICVVGGDGSLLRVMRELKSEIPVLGIAAGRRSYLMQVKKEIKSKLIM